MMCPVEYTTLGIPLVFSIEFDRITLNQPRDPWRQVNIVCDQQGLARIEFQNDSLVSRAIKIIRQNPLNGALPPDLYITLPVVIGDLDCTV